MSFMRKLQLPVDFDSTTIRLRYDRSAIPTKKNWHAFSSSRRMVPDNGMEMEATIYKARTAAPKKI